MSHFSSLDVEPKAIISLKFWDLKTLPRKDVVGFLKKILLWIGLPSISNEEEKESHM